jgi:DNA (cytosine-5)-methyltransferase 1
MITKPPYEPPMTVAQIKRRKRNGIRVASTFAGGGGSSTGYRMAGAEVVWANEFIEAARDTYKANWPKTILNGSDIRDLATKDILKEAGEIDLLDGSPPCASFSVAGQRHKHWGDVKKYSDSAQRTDDLFFEFARILYGIKPKVFVAENVKGLMQGKARGYFKMILEALKDCGYNVKARLVTASWLGVPQMRQRVIFVGVREDLNMEPVFPTPNKWFYSIADACPWVVDSSIDTPPVEGDSDLSRYPSKAPAWRSLPLGGKHHKYVQLRRAHPDLPAHTLLAQDGYGGTSAVCHPFECRKFSIAEVKRLCSFPDDYALTGSYAQQYERMGRSVPPVMMKRIAETIFEKILL